MRVALAFVKWIVEKLFTGLLEMNDDFRRTMRNSFWEALFFWFIITLFTSVFTLLTLAGLQYATGLNIPIQIWFIYIGSCVVYLLYTCVSLMYNAFKRERAELFETIKHGR